MDRRSFIRSAAITVSSGPIVARSLTADETKPSDRLNIGCIGVGGMGNGHLGRYLNRKDMQVVAVCDVDAKRKQKAKERVEKTYADAMKSGSYHGCDTYGDFRELLARTDIDAVMIATPDHWHTTISIEAAKAGKDVYCEKPLTLTLGESRDIIAAVRRYGCVFQTGSQQRSGYHGKFRFAVEMVRSGRIGRLVSAHVSVGGPSGDCFLPAEPTPDWMDWNMWLGPAPKRPYSSKLHPARWRSYRDFSGGGMTDWGAHHFDIVQWALDMDGSGPVQILPPDASPREKLTYIYANGVEVTHKGYQGPEGNGITFIGTEGRIDVNRSHLATYPETIMQDPIGPGEVHLENSSDHCENWVQAIRTRQRPICDVAIGAGSVAVCHLGNLTYWLNRPLRWDPARWQFLGDSEANRWVDRPKRAPWTV